MNTPIVEINHLSKKYQLGQTNPYLTLRDSMMNVISSPKSLFQKNSRGLDEDEFWALKDVSMEVKQGEVVGIIGPNGSGKSTLLKILSQITPPTEGEVILRERVGSLLEVGSGFHPELTGRENIYLNGAILGMSRAEVNRKFSEIVAFSGIEKFLDTPVKRYSSGMYVRLAFSVAAHLDPEILLIDEVLAVGDVEFQKKCLNRIGEVSKSGRTVLFVSHNLDVIRNICSKAIYLEKGKTVSLGDTDKVVSQYLKNLSDSKRSSIKFSETPNRNVQIKSIRLLDHRGKNSTEFNNSKPFYIEIIYKVRQDTSLPVNSSIAFYDAESNRLLLHSYESDLHPEDYSPKKKGEYKITYKVPENTFNNIRLRIWAYVFEANQSKDQYHGKDDIYIQMFDKNSFARKVHSGKRGGFFLVPLETKVEKSR